MADDKENKDSPVRLPNELRAALWKETAVYRDRGETPPSFGQLLLAAWKHLKQSQAYTGTDQTVVVPRQGNTPELTHHSQQNVINITPDDIPWVTKLLRVRRSNKPGLSSALESNLNEFLWSAERWDELSQGGGASRSEAAAGERREPAGKLPTVIGAGSHGSGDLLPKTDISQRLDEIEKNEADRKKGKTRTPRKTG